jgi:hypothetical protein
LLQQFAHAGLHTVTLPDAIDRDPPRPT